MDDRLDMRIKAGAIDAAHRYAPWRADIAWWIVGLQGVLLLLVGLWIFLNQGAGDQVVAVLGVVLVVLSGAWAWSAMRSELPQVVLGWRGLRGGIGLSVGVMVVVDFVVDYLSSSGALVALSIGLLLVGIVGALEWFVGREAMGWRWPSLIGSAIALSFGLVVLLSRLQAGLLFLQVIAAVALIGGGLLIARAALLFRTAQLAGSVAPTAPGASSSPAAIPQAPATSAGATTPAVTVRSAASSRPVEPPPSAPPPPAEGD